MKPSCKSGTRLYQIWRGMKRRCEDPGCKDYPDYGARGIAVCAEWRESFSAFSDWAWDNGYTVDRSLDRLDVNRGYSPDNCRWASNQEQQANKRKTADAYTNIRLRKDRAAFLLALIPDDAVVTLTARRDLFTEDMLTCLSKHQDKDPAIPRGERVDAARGSRKRKTAPHFTGDF